MNSVKHTFDFIVALVGLVVVSPVILFFMFLIWSQDFKSPFYVANRVGRGSKAFLMIKLRSMRVGASSSGVDSTATDDNRITPLGRIVRRFKIDELPQLLNVLLGQMSLVGPRPNVEREVSIYTEKEMSLLSIRPGITDIASIVFSDEGEILNGKPDPDLAYNQIIRPWKSRLGLFYIEKQSFILDLILIYLTFLSGFDRARALKSLHRIVTQLGAERELAELVLRRKVLVASAPPGSNKIIKKR